MVLPPQLQVQLPSIDLTDLQQGGRGQATSQFVHAADSRYGGDEAPCFVMPCYQFTIINVLNDGLRLREDCRSLSKYKPALEKVVPWLKPDQCLCSQLKHFTLLSTEAYFIKDVLLK